MQDHEPSQCQRRCSAVDDTQHPGGCHASADSEHQQWPHSKPLTSAQIRHGLPALPGLAQKGFPQCFNDSEVHCFDPSFTTLKRSAFTITLTEDSDMAAAAKMGDSSIPKNGYKTPAAIGTPAEL